MPSMSPLLLLSLTFLLAATSCSAKVVVISINSSASLELSSLAWDPNASLFVVGSSKGPSIYTIDDSGRVNCVITDSTMNSTNVSVASIAVDHLRHRLIAAFSDPSHLAAYDLTSYAKIFSVPLPELDGTSGGVTVDIESGEIFVSSATRGVVVMVGPEGDAMKVISKYEICGDQGVGGVVHVKTGSEGDGRRAISECRYHGDYGLSGIVFLNRRFILVLQPKEGRIFKIDSQDGTVNEFITLDSQTLAPTAHGITTAIPTYHYFSNFRHTIDVTTNQTVVFFPIIDETQAHGLGRKFKFGEGETIVAVTTREDDTFALVKSEEGYRIEDVTALHYNEFRMLLVVAGMFIVFLMVFFLERWCSSKMEEKPSCNCWKACSRTWGNESQCLALKEVNIYDHMNT